MTQNLDEFKKKIWDYYHAERRPFPWRDEISPYRVFVSEVMLQQTQTHRVVEKFLLFVDRFPDFTALASAPFVDVLALWKGLGYNRRALALKNAASIIIDDYDGLLPHDPVELKKLPGIGKATASSIAAFAFNHASVFIETNIRTVFIDAFFSDRDVVHDDDIMPLIAASVDSKSPRDWYYALMDYGVMLKKTKGNLNNKSAHYHRQSRFDGSDRQIRGKILEVLLNHRSLLSKNLAIVVDREPARVASILADLVREGLVKQDNDLICIS